MGEATAEGGAVVSSGVLRCPAGCTTPVRGEVRRFYSMGAFVRYCAECHPELTISISLNQDVEIQSAIVPVQREVIMFDEPVMALENGDEVSVHTGSTGSSVISVLLEGDQTMNDVSVDDLCFNLGSQLVLDDVGDFEDELDC